MGLIVQVVITALTMLMCVAVETLCVEQQEQGHANSNINDFSEYFIKSVLLQKMFQLEFMQKFPRGLKGKVQIWTQNLALFPVLPQ